MPGEDAISISTWELKLQAFAKLIDWTGKVNSASLLPYICIA